jgi:hypothetical protein
LLDSLPDNLVILRNDSADEEDLDVVLDGHEFGVIDTGFARQFLACRIDLQGNRVKTEGRLILQRMRSLAKLVDDAVFERLDPSLGASLLLVG